jgi:hypothetical protein
MSNLEHKTIWREKMKNWLKEALHNAIVHPIMVFLPTKTANKFHDWNGKWAFSRK